AARNERPWSSTSPPRASQRAMTAWGARAFEASTRVARTPSRIPKGCPAMTTSRRRFCAALGAAGLSAAALPVLGADERSPSIRVIAYNVYACKGWHDDRPRAKKAVQKGQMAQRLAMELALYEPDIINFSESPTEAIAKEVASRLGMN